MKDLNTHLQKKIVDPHQLENLLHKIRLEKKTIATLNGSFDLFHAGHLYIIFEAKKKADILLMALNSDASIQAYKDPKRPIVSLEERLKLIAAIEFVDYVTWFEETDPRALLERIKPDIHVNGVEYGMDCIESEVVMRHGGKIHLVPRIDGFSTSSYVQKIKNSI